MKMKLTIRRAIVIAFIVMMTIMLTTTGIIWRADYDWFVEQQGQYDLNAISENAADRVKYFMNGPLTLTEVYGKGILSQELYKNNNLFDMERYSLAVYKEFADDYPQISTIGFGDQKGRYLGIRFDDVTGKFNLMLKDERTKGMLNIYEGEGIDSKVVAAYEGYDPRTRPWYVPAAESKKRLWSEFYINFDEKKEATISVLNPLIDENNQLLGVIVLDVKLNGISNFLKAEKQRSGSTIYIMNERGELIGHSDSESVVITGDTPDTGKLMKAEESPNPLVKVSAKEVLSDVSKMSHMNELNVEGQHSLSLAKIYEDAYGLKWQIVVALPVSLLMGELLNHQLLSFMIIALTMLIGLLLGLYGLNRLTTSIVKTADAIENLSEGNWGTELRSDGKGVVEVTRLVNTFNKMTKALQQSFTQLRDSEEKYKTLVENSEDLIYSMNANGELIAVNAAFEKILGVSREDVLGMPIKEFFKDGAEIQAWLTETRDRANIFNIRKSTTHIVDSNGKHLTYSMIIIPILDNEEKVIGYTGTNHNLTTLMEVENEKIAALGYVVSGIAHEINTPVGNCITMATYLLSELDSINIKNIENTIKKSDLTKFVETGQESCRHMIKNLEHGRELVEAFKALAVNKSLSEPVEIHLKQFIEVVFESIASNFTQVDGQLELNCRDSLIIVSEQVKITQIFSELIENSFYHGFEGRESGKVIIDVKGPDKEGHLYILYKDDGVGLPKNIAKDLFTPFFSTKFGVTHSGLGLNVVYNSVKSVFNGEILINENVEQGFELKLILTVNAK